MGVDIVSVKYEDNYMPKIFTGKAYSYYTALSLQVGDLVVAPTSYGDKIARVTEINIPEYKVENIKNYFKIITHKIDKQKYLEENQILRQTA